MRYADLHSHLIPELDDGSTSLFETIEMLRHAHSTGTRAIVATPHMFASFGNSGPLLVYDAYVDMMKRLERLASAGDHAFLSEIAVYLGSENFVSPEFLTALERRDVLTLNGSRYLLIEFPPYLPYESAISAIETVLARKLVPVLAHVERYGFLHGRPARLAKLRERGCVTQVNADALIDPRSGGVDRSLQVLFDQRLVDLVASDGHDAHSRPPDLGAAHESLITLYPEPTVAEWMWENPARILHDRPISRVD